MCGAHPQQGPESGSGRPRNPGEGTTPPTAPSRSALPLAGAALSGRVQSSLADPDTVQRFFGKARPDVKCLEVIHSVTQILDDGRRKTEPCAHPSCRAIFEVPKGELEVISVLPRGMSYQAYQATGKPVLWMFHGWWGNASQQLVAMQKLADQGFMVRAISLEGHGDSRYNRVGFFERIKNKLFGAYPDSAADALMLLPNESKALYLHSAASHWVQRAFTKMEAIGGDVADSLHSITKLIFAAPVVDTGTAGGTLRYWGKATSELLRKADPTCWYRYLAQVKFWGEKTGLNYVVDSVQSARATLFNRASDPRFVREYLKELDIARYAEYAETFLRGLLRITFAAEHNVARANRVLLRFDEDQNYSRAGHQRTASHWGAQYTELLGVTHQGLARPRDIETVVAWLSSNL